MRRQVKELIAKIPDKDLRDKLSSNIFQFNLKSGLGDLLARLRHADALEGIWKEAKGRNDTAATGILTAEIDKLHKTLWISLGDPHRGFDPNARPAAATEEPSIFEQAISAAKAIVNVAPDAVEILVDEQVKVIENVVEAAPKVIAEGAKAVFEQARAAQEQLNELASSELYRPAINKLLPGLENRIAGLNSDGDCVSMEISAKIPVMKAVDVEVSGESEVVRTGDPPRYTVTAGGKIGATLGEALSLGVGFGGKVELTVKTPQEAAQAAKLFIQLAATKAPFALPKSDMDFLQDHVSAFEGSLDVNANASAGIFEGGIASSARFRFEVGDTKTSPPVPPKVVITGSAQVKLGASGPINDAGGSAMVDVSMAQTYDMTGPLAEEFKKDPINAIKKANKLAETATVTVRGEGIALDGSGEAIEAQLTADLKDENTRKNVVSLFKDLLNLNGQLPDFDKIILDLEKLLVPIKTKIEHIRTETKGTLSLKISGNGITYATEDRKQPPSPKDFKQAIQDIKELVEKAKSQVIPQVLR